MKVSITKILQITKRLIWDSKISLLSILLAAIGISGMFIAFFPSLQNASVDFNAYVEAFPKEMLSAFGITDTDFNSFDVFISGEYLGFFWAMVFLPVIVGWSMKIAKEAENGTLSLTLSYPISRTQIALSYLLAITFKAIFSAFVMVYSVVFLSQFIDVTIDYGNWTKYFMLVTIMMLAIAYLGAFLAILLLKVGRAASILSVFIVGSYFINIVSRLFEDLESIKYISVFYYYGDPLQVIRHGEIMSESIYVFIGMMLAFFLGSILLFRKRDLNKG